MYSELDASRPGVNGRPTAVQRTACGTTCVCNMVACLLTLVWCCSQPYSAAQPVEPSLCEYLGVRCPVVYGLYDYVALHGTVSPRAAALRRARGRRAAGPPGQPAREATAVRPTYRS